MMIYAWKNVESEEELLTCESLRANNEQISENYSYTDVEKPACMHALHAGISAQKYRE